MIRAKEHHYSHLIFAAYFFLDGTCFSGILAAMAHLRQVLVK